MSQAEYKRWLNTGKLVKGEVAAEQWIHSHAAEQLTVVLVSVKSSTPAELSQ